MKRNIVSSTLRKQGLWRFHGSQPGSQKNYKTHVKASSRASMSLKGTSPHQTYLGPHQFTPKCSSKQGFSAQEGNAYQPYNGNLQNKVRFDIQPTNPQADIMATGHCEYWITGSQPLISWSIKKIAPYPPQMTLCFLMCTLTR